MVKINDNEVLMVTQQAFYIYDMQQMIFSQIQLQSTTQQLNPKFQVIDISNYNLGIFLYLVDNSPN